MFTPKAIVLTGLCAASVVCMTADAQAQRGLFLSRAVHNARSQQAYNQQHPTSMIIRARQAGNAGHQYISRQGMSNAMQTAYENAYSRNPHTRLGGIQALLSVANSRFASPHVRQTAQNAYYQARIADSQQTAFANRQHALNALALRGYSNVRVAPQHSNQWGRAQQSAASFNQQKQTGVIMMGSH